MRIRTAIVALTCALALSACGTPPPPPPGYVKQEFFVARPAVDIYHEFESAMSSCKETTSIFGSADVDSAFDRATGHGRLRVEREGRVLWGAEMLREKGGSRVLVFASRDVAADHYIWLMHQWALRTYKPGLFPDC